MYLSSTNSDQPSQLRRRAPPRSIIVVNHHGDGQDPVKRGSNPPTKKESPKQKHSTPRPTRGERNRPDPPEYRTPRRLKSNLTSPRPRSNQQPHLSRSPTHARRSVPQQLSSSLTLPRIEQQPDHRGGLSQSLSHGEFSHKQHHYHRQKHMHSHQTGERRDTPQSEAKSEKTQSKPDNSDDVRQLKSWKKSSSFHSDPEDMLQVYKDLQQKQLDLNTRFSTTSIDEESTE